MPPRLGAVLRIDRATYDAIVAHAREDHQAERTGLADDEVEFRSFRIVDGEVTEEPVEVVESYLFGHTPTTVVYD